MVGIDRHRISFAGVLRFRLWHMFTPFGRLRLGQYVERIKYVPQIKETQSVTPNRDRVSVGIRTTQHIGTMGASQAEFKRDGQGHTTPDASGWTEPSDRAAEPTATGHLLT
jgi:hypothetical protein